MVERSPTAPRITVADTARRLVVAAVVVGSSLGTTASSQQAGATAESSRPTAAAFDQRKDRYIDAMDDGRPEHFDHEAAAGMLLLERAQRTGDDRDVERANRLILASLRSLDLSDANDEYSAQHGGAFTFIRLALQFGDEPDLLFPSTYEAIVRGRYPDGALRPDKSLLAYRDQLFASAYNAQNVGLDVRTGESWDPAGYDQYNGTENHKLQSLVTGMLLAEIYAGDDVGGVPVKDDTETLDDQWHYYRDAFFRYSEAWGDGRADHFTRDAVQTEEDSIQYLPTHLGDYWLLRDLHSDPAVRAHAEVLIDRLLADWAEDLVGPIHTGATERTYHVDLADGLSHQEHVLNYLLFDNLGEPLRLDSDELFDFGGWASVGVAMSDYVPGNPEFPMVLVDIARDKAEGYTVREGGRDHNWVESDFSLGLRLDGAVSVEDLAGGFQVVAADGGAAAGRMVTVFHGETPFSKDKPQFVAAGVQAGRSALYRSVAASDPANLWVHPDFANVVTDGRWLFVEQPSWSGRTVYFGVGIGKGTLRDRGNVAGGRVFRFEVAGDVAVWEVATSDDVASFEEFQTRMRDADFSVGGASLATYVSPFTGVELDLSADRASRTVDGEPVDWSAYEHSFSTPWGSHALGSTSASISRDGRSVEWDWDPNGSGAYDAPPDKRVVNASD